jgi:hypothetical protein
MSIELGVDFNKLRPKFQQSMSHCTETWIVIAMHRSRIPRGSEAAKPVGGLRAIHGPQWAHFGYVSLVGLVV